MIISQIPDLVYIASSLAPIAVLILFLLIITFLKKK